MLTLKEVNEIKEMYKKYKISGDPFHLNMIYINFGLPGALYLGKFDVAVTMIKKTPSYINSEYLDEHENEIILNMLSKDFKHHIDIVNSVGSQLTLSEEDEKKKESSFNQIQMILDICEELSLTQSSTQAKKLFLLNIYEKYTELNDYEDLTLLNNIIKSNYLSINEIIEIVFEKDIAEYTIYELGEMLLNVTPYPEMYQDILNLLILFYIRAKFIILRLNEVKISDNEEERKEARLKRRHWKTTIEGAKMSITESVTNLNTGLVLKTLNMIENIGKYSITFKSSDNNLDDNEYENVFHDIKYELLNSVKDYIIYEIEDIVKECEESILQDTFYEMTYEDGIRRAAILKFMREEAPTYNTEGMFDMREEVQLLNILDI